MLLGTMSRTFPEIFSLLLICLRYKPNAPGLLRHNVKQMGFQPGVKE